FFSAVFPAAFTSPWPGAVFVAGLASSAALASRWVERGRAGAAWAAGLRIAMWLATVTPALPRPDVRVLVAACGFGVMAFGIRRVLSALAAGASGPPAALSAGLAQAEEAPRRLAALNFVLWLGCIGVGVTLLESNPGPHWSDIVMPLAFGSLFAFGVSFYQRG